MLYLGGHTEESIEAIPNQVKNVLIGMISAGILGPVANKIDSYRLGSLTFDLLRVVYSALGGKKNLVFPDFYKFAPESDIPRFIKEQGNAESAAQSLEQHTMSPEEMASRLWRQSQQFENT